MQWQMLPPLSMTSPVLDLSGILEPAYEVGGDSFDYAFNEHVLHVAVFDAMGHGLEAATMATVIIADRKSTRLNSSHANISYAVFCLKKKIPITLSSPSLTSE